MRNYAVLRFPKSCLDKRVPHLTMHDGVWWAFTSLWMASGLTPREAYDNLIL